MGRQVSELDDVAFKQYITVHSIAPDFVPADNVVLELWEADEGSIIGHGQVRTRPGMGVESRNDSWIIEVTTIHSEVIPWFRVQILTNLDRTIFKDNSADFISLGVEEIKQAFHDTAPAES